MSSTLNQVDWNAELVRGDLAQAIQQLKQEPGQGLFLGGVKLPLALAELGLIDEHQFIVLDRSDAWHVGNVPHVVRPATCEMRTDTRSRA